MKHANSKHSVEKMAVGALKSVAVSDLLDQRSDVISVNADWMRDRASSALKSAADDGAWCVS